MPKTLNLFLLYIILGINTFAQNDIAFTAENFPNQKSEFKDALVYYNDALDLFDEKDYYSAITNFVKANEFNPNCADLHFKLGICYLHTSEKINAYDHLKKGKELRGHIPSEMTYFLALSHHYLLEFEDAIELYKFYKETNQLSEESIREVDKKIEECNNGIALRDNRTIGLVVNVKEINSEYSDYSPMITPDQKTMIFTSRRKTPDGEVDPRDMQYYENIYISHFEDNKWSEPVPISEVSNSKDHDANVGISNDGQAIYVYNSNNGLGDLYKTTLEGSYWTAPIALPEPFNSAATEKCIAFSPDLNTAYFVSNRDGSIGGLDIFYANKNENGQFTEFYNMGDSINTIYDEDGIFIHPDGNALYFSSKGHNTMGGYDIFISLRDSNGIWSKPINLGQPVNSADDDVFLFVSADGKTGYFSSVKEGGKGDKDIYKINFSEEDPGLYASKMLLVKGKVCDAITNKAVKANIEITDIKTQKNITKVYSNESSGEFMLSLPAGRNYALTATHEDYLFFSENFNLSDTTSYLQIELSMPMSKIAENSSSILRNIFFDYGESILKPESKQEADRLFKLLKAYPNMTIEISGHTDNISSKKFNKELSKKRANSVANYLIKKGIKRERFITKGYGFSMPIADNSTEKGRQKNRRVEFKILTK